MNTAWTCTPNVENIYVLQSPDSGNNYEIRNLPADTGMNMFSDDPRVIPFIPQQYDCVVTASTTIATTTPALNHQEGLFVIMVFIVLLAPPFFRFLFGSWVR